MELFAIQFQGFVFSERWKTIEVETADAARIAVGGSSARLVRFQ
jgi:hypothetical protein